MNREKERGKREREKNSEIKKEIVRGGGRLEGWKMDPGGKRKKRQPYDEPVAG